MDKENYVDISDQEWEFPGGFTWDIDIRISKLEDFETLNQLLQ